MTWWIVAAALWGAAEASFFFLVPDILLTAAALRHGLKAGLLLSVAVSMAGLFAIGLLIAAVAKTSTAANVIGRLAFFPLMFFAGLWLPRALMPALLLDISNYTPLGAAVQAMQSSMQTGFPPTAPLLVLAAYAIVFGFLARRFFAWE